MYTVNIINDIVTYINNKGFKVSKSTVENLFLSLKSQSFVILSGVCGSGKTSLARLFAMASGATSQNGRFLLLPVGADWRSSDILLGSLGADGKFHPGYITAFLKNAIANPSVPYFLCLDEFNLSRPEQYMSTLLSVMSTRRRGENGSVVTDMLISRKSYGEDINSYNAYGDIWLPDNLYIIATANFDETSYPLMPKVLDRAFVIELDCPELAVSFDFDDEHTPSDLVGNIENDFLKSDFITISDCKSGRELIREYSFIIQDINRFLKHLPSPLTYRSRDAILFYYAYNCKYDIFDKHTLTDLMIMQKFLVRIYGATNHIKSCLCELFKYCLSRDGENSSEYANSSYKMYQAMSKYGCKYPRSAEKIILMLRRYEEDGYATFWM